MLSSITETLTRINNSYGYGDLIGVVLDKDMTGGQAVIARTSCEPEKRRFQFDLERKTIRFANRQRKID